jgi:hypothetical protein
MASSLVSLYNQALAALGVDPIADPGAALKEAELCNLFYPDTRDEVLLENDWSCAIREKKLAIATAEEGQGFTFAYQLPVDPKCLRVISLTREDGSEIDKQKWVKQGSLILTDEQEVWARYVFAVPSVPDIDLHVAEAIIAKLASKLAFPITQSLQLEQAAAGRYLMLILNAKMIEGQIRENKPHDIRLWSEAQ